MTDKTERISIRLTKDQKAKIRVYAAEHDMTISELFLLAMLKLISQEQREEDDSKCIK